MNINAKLPPSLPQTLPAPPAADPADAKPAREVTASAGIATPIETQRIGARLPSGQKPRVLIIGGGFGGRAAAKALSGHGTQLTLIDKSASHTFLPNIFQVASGLVNRDAVETELQRDLGPGTKVVRGEVMGLDLHGRRVSLDDGTTLDYDYLIVAAGTQSAYFGHDEWAPLTFPLKTVADAERIRERVHEVMDRASVETDPDRRRALLTFAVVGGGPSGVEMAGSLVEMTGDLAAQYPGIDAGDVRITVVEGGERLLGPFDEKSAASATRALRKAGVEVLTSTRVEDIKPGSVKVGGRVLAAETVVWTAGTEGSPVGKMLGVDLERGGLVRVGDDLSLPGRREVFVIGDLALAQSGGQRVPAVAQGASQGGEHAARGILADMTGGERTTFTYNDLGKAAYVTEGSAVVEAMGIRLTGLPGWLAWMAIHLVQMPKSFFAKLGILAANLVGFGPGRERRPAPSVALVNDLHALPRSTVRAA